jgi:hypothetical protein
VTILTGPSPATRKDVRSRQQQVDSSRSTLRLDR